MLLKSRRLLRVSRLFACQVAGFAAVEGASGITRAFDFRGRPRLKVIGGMTSSRSEGVAQIRARPSSIAARRRADLDTRCACANASMSVRSEGRRLTGTARTVFPIAGPYTASEVNYCDSGKSPREGHALRVRPLGTRRRHPPTVHGPRLSTRASATPGSVRYPDQAPSDLRSPLMRKQGVDSVERGYAPQRRAGSVHTLQIAKGNRGRSLS